jgi:hypothetical protein
MSSYPHVPKRIAVNKLQGKPQPPASPRERAQTLILIAMMFVVLMAFVGVVTDFGSIYISWTQLKRGIDAASVAAANNMKTTIVGLSQAQRKEFMTEAARETLALNDITNIDSLVVFNCDDLAELPADHILQRMCPTAQGTRKLAWVEAQQNVPVYFLSILGVQTVPLTLNSIGEAAVLDLVLVFDTSESMGNATSGFRETDFDPAACNAANNCQPLRGAKDAAKNLIDRLYPGYDRVALVTFDYQATVVLGFTENLALAKDRIDGTNLAENGIRLHDDAPLDRFAWQNTRCADASCLGKYSPIFPEDRDGDGLDVDFPASPCVPYDDSFNNVYRVDFNSYNPNDPNWNWDEDLVPCDNDNTLDVFNWDNDPSYSEANPTDQTIYDDPSDPVVSQLQALYNSGQLNEVYNRTTFVSTCIGCGIRQGTELLVETGRPGGVWVMVFLTDGVANLSDNPYNWFALPDDTPGFGIPSNLDYGFCTDGFWSDWCRDYDPSPRYCIDASADSCPPGSQHTSPPTNGLYSASDYAFDRVDDAGLLFPTTLGEPIGADIVLYSIIFGTASDLAQGLPLMHYMADVGDDGARGGPCEDITNVATQCGNYYYAANASILQRVFEDIAARIFTKISR